MHPTPEPEDRAGAVPTEARDAAPTPETPAPASARTRDPVAPIQGWPLETRRPAPRGPRLSIGARGEALAAGYLAGVGMNILARNWHSKYGELDLVARDGATLVAVEVKTRTGTQYGDPLTAITAQKVSRLRRLLLEWVRVHAPRTDTLRVDAIGIVIRPGRSPRIDHIRGIS